MGLPVTRFLAATNINDVVPEYLKTGTYKPRPSIATVANAMDVGDPSNFARILDLYHNSHSEIEKEVLGFSYSDPEIKTCIKLVKEKYGYITDPHGATGFMALSEFIKKNKGWNGIFLETAHPAKFSETVENAISEAITIPEKLAEFGKRKKISKSIKADYKDLKEYLMEQ